MKRIVLTILFFIFVLVPFSVFAKEPIKILLVPGHDNESWGAQYGNIKEAAMNLAVATRIYNILKKDKKFEVYITRDSNGYKKEFLDYLSLQREEILTFEKNAKKLMQNEISNGSFVQKENPPHSRASDENAIRLYGFSKWANDNNIDAVVHIHFNDYPRKNKWAAGEYKGFTIYKPDEQLVNSTESSNLALSIFNQLHKKYITSTYPPEAGGLVSDQKLIALGSNGTLLASVRSVLIEYGYIYRFGNSVTRHKAYDIMAGYTATGIKNYFFPQN